ncbi:MAG: hypothetical protein ACKOTB_09205 [Planctomycetia bacterium]
MSHVELRRRCRGRRRARRMNDAVAVGPPVLPLLSVALGLFLGHAPWVAADDDTVVPGGGQAAARVVENRIDLDQQLSGMLFQPSGDMEAVRQRIEERVALEISALDEVAELNASQKRTCETAAGLDVARLFEAVEAVRDRYAGRMIDLQDAQGQEEWQRFIPEVQALQSRLQDADGDDKLLVRLLPAVLDAAQQEAWRQELAARSRWQWGSVVEAGMAQFDAALGLTAKQHEAIRELLLERPVRVSTPRLRQHGGHFIPFVCRYALSQVDRKRLEACVSPRQWQSLAAAIEQGRGMVQHLKQTKIILE